MNIFFKLARSQLQETDRKKLDERPLFHNEGYPWDSNSMHVVNFSHSLISNEVSRHSRNP